mmetsp:Transcript_33175/g.57308  ORF Transcript_33175/g.57308 Transcript_33175/m.57308 type:complete len:187 (+) Transcript_33175:48-608(+)
MATSASQKEDHVPSVVCRRLSQMSNTLVEGSIKSLFKYIGEPGFISLGGGIPNDSVFPYESMTVTLADGGHLQLQKKALVTTDIQPKRGATLDQKGGKNGDQIHSDEEEEDCTSSTVMQHDLLLNYGMGMGHPEVAAWVREHVAAQHRPPARDWDTCMTVGSTDAIYKARCHGPHHSSWGGGPKRN